MPDKSDTFTTGRRIRAAMALAGVESFERLAELVDTRNLGVRTLRKLADDKHERDAQRYELRAIADATGIPFEFFTVTDGQFTALFDNVDEAPTTEIDDLRSQVADLVEAITALSSGDAETALRAARSAAERAPRETAQDAASRRRHLAPAPAADQEAR